MKAHGLAGTLIIVLLSLTAIGQNTIGTIHIEDGALDGLTFFSPFSGSKAYLVDNCGRLVNRWDRGTKPGLSAYFLDNGLMFRTYKVAPKGPFTSSSNAGGLEMVDWNNNTVWSYEINTEFTLSHHDAFAMPNGNILVLIWDVIDEDELIALGRNPNEIDPTGFAWSERIIEIEPVDSSQANIVWEWWIRDHFIQDFDTTLSGYGDVSEHPELFDINFPELNSGNSHSNYDWNHINAVAYDAVRDEILLSARNSDEIWILDHSTTTEEAATHTGGLHNMGGDLLYRWGNSATYQRGSVSDQKLFGQHGVNWIDNGLADKGKILIFNNGNGRPGVDYSTAEILEPERDDQGGYILTADDPFGPEESDRIFGNQTSDRRYSAFLSNAQRLNNGNTLINYGSLGTIVEVDSEDNLVWEYVIPLRGDSPLMQGQNASSNWTFRAYKYGMDFSGFYGQDLSPGETIESGTDLSDCEMSTAVVSVSLSELDIYWNSSARVVRIDIPIDIELRIDLIDVSGRIIASANAEIFPFEMSLPRLASGIYFLRIMDKKGNVRSTLLFTTP